MFNPSSSSRHYIAVRALLCIACAAMACSAAFAQTPPLNFYKNYIVTGDYAVSGVGLRGTGDASGFASGTIKAPSPPLPGGADIVAAFLYWQTVEKDRSSHAGQNGFFNLHAITGTVLGNDNAPVSWSAGGCAGSSNGTTTLRTYRADVRPFLSTDGSGVAQWITDYGVRLADSGSNGGGTPLTLGATLVVIYRVAGQGSPFPLNAITIYDGTFAPSNSSQSMSLRIQGFYESSDNPNVLDHGHPTPASLTEIVGNGQSNKGEQVFFNGNQLTLPGGNFPFAGPWDTLRTPVTMPPDLTDDQILTTSVVPTSTNSGCVSWGAVIVATTVKSSDGDGLIDSWKRQPRPGYPDYSNNNDFVDLPGAASGEKDLFIQIDWLASHDYITSGGTQGHTHMPKKAAIDMVGDAFLHSRAQIHLHIDCGGCYPPLPGAAADPYIISGGSGGNVIDESNVVCQDQPATQNSPAIYCEFPGVVATSWKGGFETLKNHLEDPIPDPPGTPPPPRFQHGRKDSYHYVLFGHALGLATNVWSISSGTLTSVVVNNDGTAKVTTSTPHGLASGARIRISGAVSPVPVSQQDFALNGTYPSITVTSDTTFTFSLLTSVPVGTYANPGLFVSSGAALSTSGWSDFAGADSLITLGLWRSDNPADDQVGSVLIQAGTLMHELGHTLGLQHGGGDAVNCKSNFESVMNYMFQVRGLIDIHSVANVDYSSGQGLSPLSESSLSDGTGIGGNVTYGTRWYAPFSQLDIQINNLAGGHAATRHCDGTAIGANETTPMVRLDGPAGAGAPLDWNNNGQVDGAAGQDIDFNGPVTDQAFLDYNEWMNIVDLTQIGARKGVFGFSSGVWGTLDVGAGGTLEVGAGGTLDVGAGGTLDVGAGGTLDNGAGGTLDVGAGGQESNFDEANTTVDPPGSLTFTTTKKSVILNWSAPGFGQIRTYFIWRAVVISGVPVSPNSYVNIGSVSAANGPAPKTFTDTNVKHNTTYKYFVTAALASPSKGVPGNQSGASNFVTVPF